MYYSIVYCPCPAPRCKSAEQGRGRRDGLENGWNGFRNLGCLTFSGPGLPPATCSGPHCREKSEALAGPETNWFWSHQRPHQHPACPTIGSNFDIDIQPFSQFREGPYLTYRHRENVGDFNLAWKPYILERLTSYLGPSCQDIWLPNNNYDATLIV